MHSSASRPAEHSRSEASPIYLRPTPPRRASPSSAASWAVSTFFEQLLLGPRARRVVVVRLPADDPTQVFTQASVRLWQYPHERDDELIVPQFARQQGLPAFTGGVKTPEFLAIFIQEWRPELCLRAAFGQKIPTALINPPSSDCYNFRHSGDTWPW